MIFFIKFVIQSWRTHFKKEFHCMSLLKSDSWASSQVSSNTHLKNFTDAAFPVNPQTYQSVLSKWVQRGDKLGWSIWALVPKRSAQTELFKLKQVSCKYWGVDILEGVFVWMLVISKGHRLATKGQIFLSKQNEN